MNLRRWRPALWALAGFVLVAALVELGWIDGLDAAVLQAVAAYRARHLTEMALSVTALGTNTLLVLGIGVAGIQLWGAGRRTAAATIALAPLLASATELALKAVFGRPRPMESIAPVPGSFSFPSGHATTTTALYLLLGLLVAQTQSDPRTRRVTLAMAAAIPLLVAASRVYLGVHYVSDVVGGMLLGAVFALGGYTLVSGRPRGGTQ